MVAKHDRFPAPAHAHGFAALTSETMGHAHFLVLNTYPTNGSGTDGHVHRYQGITRTDAGHFHRFFGSTRPAIPLPDGSHVHEISAEVDDEPFIFLGNYYETVQEIPRHTHAFFGRTGTPIGQEPSNW
ncbi:YmaF family protein [Paenibacillus thermotolerans]|uniref:YmaF family protein n=1 Tax=Paenibacillus thermotolerans TaxID=3027807 RepID=UPI002367F440|nr:MULTISPECIES: YmaF family protein [unclassified Paenibacillus]